MKKILIFITILGLIFIGTPQTKVDALIYNGVDYRILETGASRNIEGDLYYPVVINADYGGSYINNWLYYMQVNNIHRVEMQGPNVFDLYFYIDGSLTTVASSVFKIDLGYDTGYTYFYMTLYGLNQQVIDIIDFAYSENTWNLPGYTEVLINADFQSNQYVYQQGYNEGYDAGYNAGEYYGYNNGYSNGYDTGYYAGINSTHNEAYQQGYQKGANDSFLSGLQNWIVPAIIVVIILGGFITVIHKRKDGDI